MDKTVLSKGINYGLILGFILALSTVYGYGVNQDFFLSPWPMIITFLSLVIVGILAIASVKKEFGGFISFKNAFSTYFVTIAIGLLISAVVGTILFNFVDPAFAESLKEKTVQKMIDTFDQYNIEMTDQMEASIDAMKNTNVYGIPQQIKSYFMGVAFSSVLGLLLALILKNNNPDEA